MRLTWSRPGSASEMVACSLPPASLESLSQQSIANPSRTRGKTAGWAPSPAPGRIYAPMSTPSEPCCKVRPRLGWRPHAHAACRRPRTVSTDRHPGPHLGLGPKGLAVARELADGLLTVNGETEFANHFTWTALGVQGTVLQEGEALDSPRVRAAPGPRETRWHTTQRMNSAAMSPACLPGTYGWTWSTSLLSGNDISWSTTSTSSR